MIIRQWRTPIVIMLAILISVLMFPIPGGHVTSPQDNSPMTGMKYPGLAPESAMPPSLVKFGDPTAFIGSVLTLDQFGQKIANSDNPLMQWSTQLAAFGVGADGYYWIWILPSQVGSLTPDWEQRMVSALNSAARGLGFTGDVPVKIAIATGAGGYYSSGTRTGVWRPIVGGVEFTMNLARA